MSAHIAIRCDECGKARFGPGTMHFHKFRDVVGIDGWESNSTIDHCPICVAKRKVREKVEADAKA